MKPTYLMPDPDEPDVRLPLTRPVSDIVLDLFTAYPDHGPVFVCSGLTNEPHARYVRNTDGSVTWFGRVQSRPNKRPRTVAQSPNVGLWIDLGVVVPTPVPDDRDAPPTFSEDLIGDDPDSKWSQWYEGAAAREDYRAAVVRLVEAGIITALDQFPDILD